MLNFLFWMLNIATFLVVYFMWIRPILRKTATFKEFYDNEESFFGALSSKFAGIKGRLTAGLIYLASAVVTMHDYLAPKLTGVDVAPLFPKIMAAVPNEAWPLIAIGVTMLLDWFRVLADRREE